MFIKSENCLELTDQDESCSNYCVFKRNGKRGRRLRRVRVNWVFWIVSKTLVASKPITASNSLGSILHWEGLVDCMATRSRHMWWIFIQISFTISRRIPIISICGVLQRVLIKVVFRSYTICEKLQLFRRWYISRLICTIAIFWLFTFSHSLFDTIPVVSWPNHICFALSVAI